MDKPMRTDFWCDEYWIWYCLHNDRLTLRLEIKLLITSSANRKNCLFCYFGLNKALK